MIFETERLYLRPWEEEDAKALYECAKDPKVGPSAGWHPHKSVEESLETIKTILTQPETYAVCSKELCQPIGSIGLMRPNTEQAKSQSEELEIGFWLASPYWGRGYIPEAVRALLEYAFRTLGINTMWCGYFDGNEKSKRCQEKCGFLYHHTERDKLWEVTGEIKTEHFMYITKERWENELRS